MTAEGNAATHRVVRVILPYHLRTLAGVGKEVEVEVDVGVDRDGPLTQRALLDALEHRYPVLRGTIRDHGTQTRRPFVRFFVGQEDVSHEPPDAPLPPAVAAGTESFSIIGAMAGG